MRRLLLCMMAIGLLLISACKTTIYNVYPLDELSAEGNGIALLEKLGKEGADGFPYALPRTVLELHIEVEKVTKNRGYYCKSMGADQFSTKLSDKGIDLGRIITEDAVEYRVKGVTLSTSSEPDPSQRFYLEIKSDSFTARELKATLGELGNMAGSTGRATDKTFEFIVETLSQVSSLAVGAGSFGSDREGGQDDFDYDLEKLKSLTADYEDFALMLERDADRRVDPSTYDKVCAQFQDRIKVLLDKFRGTTSTDTRILTVKVRLKSDQGLSDSTIFTESSLAMAFANRIDYAVDGWDDGNATGKKMSLDVVPLKEDADSMAEIQTILEGLGDGRDSGKAPYGLAYRIPCRAQVVVRYGDQVRNLGEVVVAQFGKVGFLPRELKGKESGLEVTYHQDTGALKTVSVDTTPYSASDIKSLGEAAQSLMSTESTKLQQQAADEEAKATILKSKVSQKESEEKLKELEE